MSARVHWPVRVARLKPPTVRTACGSWDASVSADVDPRAITCELCLRRMPARLVVFGRLPPKVPPSPSAWAVFVEKLRKKLVTVAGGLRASKAA